jgi:hypothetical protein
MAGASAANIKETASVATHHRFFTRYQYPPDKKIYHLGIYSFSGRRLV